MRERIGQLTGLVEGMPWMGTFHSIGAKILRRHAELVGLKPNFTILDTDDQIRLLKQVLQAHNIDDKRWPARALAAQIDGWKNRGLDPSHVPAGESAAFANGKGAELYALYQERLKILNAVDFGDLLLECLRLFRERQEILRTVPAAASLYPRRRISGHQRRPISLAAPSGAGEPQPLLRRRRRSVDLWMARRRCRQYPAIRARFSRRQSHPPGTQLSLHRAYSGRRRRPHRP